MYTCLNTFLPPPPLNKFINCIPLPPLILDVDKDLLASFLRRWRSGPLVHHTIYNIFQIHMNIHECLFCFENKCCMKIIVQKFSVQKMCVLFNDNVARSRHKIVFIWYFVEIVESFILYTGSAGRTICNGRTGRCLTLSRSKFHFKLITICF